MHMQRAPGQIVVISATVGAGHDAVASELARRLRAFGFDVTCHDFMQLLPLGLGQRAVRAHRAILRRAPWFYGLLFGLSDRSRLTPPLTRLLLRPAGRRIAALVPADAVALVSTYPLASQVLGALRRRGRLHAPAITYATDFGVHRHWVAPGVDVNLVPHAVGAARARRFGGSPTSVAGALVGERFRPVPPAAKRDARARFGLPPGRLALVVAGSWGVGELEETAADIAASRAAVPVVVCGHNAALRRRLIESGVPYALGWVDDMPALMQAADVLVENAGGNMALEGMACGLPVLTYRPIRGHGTQSAAALEQAGITTWVRSRGALGPALVDVADGSQGRSQKRAAEVLFTTDAAECVADLVAVPPRAIAPTHIERRRWRTTVAGAAAAALTIAAIARRRMPR
jgi:UDP-N-acetylglucosamine:LPS N-acetylglucosamine transferase